jgi:hypothetical protein
MPPPREDVTANVHEVVQFHLYSDAPAGQLLDLPIRTPTFFQYIGRSEGIEFEDHREIRLARMATETAGQVSIQNKDTTTLHPPPPTTHIAHPEKASSTTRFGKVTKMSCRKL